MIARLLDGLVGMMLFAFGCLLLVGIAAEIQCQVEQGYAWGLSVAFAVLVAPMALILAAIGVLVVHRAWEGF